MGAAQDIHRISGLRGPRSPVVPHGRAGQNMVRALRGAVDDLDQALTQADTIGLAGPVGELALRTASLCH